HLVQVPPVRCPAPAVTKSRTEDGADLPAPQPDGLVADRYAPFGEQLLHVPVTQVEPVGEPDGMADDLRGKPVAPVQRVTGRRTTRSRGGHRLMLPRVARPTCLFPSAAPDLASGVAVPTLRCAQRTPRWGGRPWQTALLRASASAGVLGWRCRHVRVRYSRTAERTFPRQGS